ncbi:MAG TPA: sigma-54 dependent transcriptional regulator [Arenicellales bacterium]|nr:sigma-54 dependent transcriptional regulator [Arenicellales bacterium]
MSEFDRILGDSPQLQAVLRAARIAAATDVTVLVMGETGTGKELLARAIHAGSRRAERPLVTLNCATLPEPLAESEIFGHRRGAFTGATGERPGRIRAAHGGTLFLDEVGELPAAVQAKLLRFLESGECQAVGQVQPDILDVRLVTATNRDLYADVRAGRFRADLYYRLNIVPVSLPALRERDGDVDLLLERFTSELAARHQLAPPRYARCARECLRRYSWPGNIRELRNFCERTAILLSGRTVKQDNLPREIREHALQPEVPAGFRLPDSGLRLEELEAAMIRQALTRAAGNRSRAARLLGLTRDTLLYRMKKYGLQTA